MARECECPEGHTVTKLGHCESCEFRGVYPPVDTWLMKELHYRAAVGCGSEKHHDGTPHDFDWATYADETTTYGVCRCRLRDIDSSERTL